MISKNYDDTAWSDRRKLNSWKVPLSKPMVRVDFFSTNCCMYAKKQYCIVVPTKQLKASDERQDPIYDYPHVHAISSTKSF